jgi:hypothetical protein
MCNQLRSRSAGTSVLSDQDLQVFIHYVISDQEANSVDHDQMVGMSWLIWIYTVHTCDNGGKYGVKGYGSFADTFTE